MRSSMPPSPLVALWAWLVPGAGYWAIRERARGTVVFVTVLAVFAMGVLIGGLRVVDAPTKLSSAALLDKPWFIGQVMAGPVSIAAAITAGHVDPARVSHSRSWEIGTLYTAIAGMLNLLALIDSAHRASLPAKSDEGEKA